MKLSKFWSHCIAVQFGYTCTC